MTTDSDTFYSLVTYFHTKIPLIYETSGMDYYFVLPNMSPGAPIDPAKAGQLQDMLIFPEVKIEDIMKAIDPLWKDIQTADWATGLVYVFGIPTMFPSFMEGG